MQKQILIVAFFAAIAVFQTVFSHSFAVFGVKPDILLIAVVAWGFVRGSEEGIFAGILAGFLEDVFSAGFYLHMITKPFIGFLAGALSGGLSTSLSFIYPVTCGILTLVSYVLEVVFSYFFFGRLLPSAHSLISVIFIATLYNAILSAMLGPFFGRVIGRIMGEESAGRAEYSVYHF